MFKTKYLLAVETTIVVSTVSNQALFKAFAKVKVFLFMFSKFRKSYLLFS